MAASELNNRLDYLISFSSQLVFVCSDKIQQQSKVVESFLAHQNEQADLALLTANELTPLVTYREKLFRQLISQSQQADFNRPLNQLLAPLNNHNGPILISIFQAEKLPNKLVKELWDLVLQSRFANNKQHLNILLMGLSDWAESAKAGLGSKSKEQPIVLNSQSDIQYTEPRTFSGLEPLIQNKRERFTQPLQNRHSQPFYKKWWITTSLGFILPIIFAGILSWQYPENVRAIMSYIDTKLPDQEQSNKQPPSVAEPAQSASAQAPEPAPKSIEEITPLTSTLMANQAGTKEILVTDWSAASAKLEEQSKKVLLQTSNTKEQSNKEPIQTSTIKQQSNKELIQTSNIKQQSNKELIQASNIEQPVDTQKKPLLAPEQPTFVSDLAAPNDTVNDYQIEDKVVLTPLPKQAVTPIVDIANIHTDDFFNPKSDALLALPTENFVIQIGAMANISILQDYVRDEQLTQQIWLYKTQRYGGDWYVLLKNQHYPSIEDARAEIVNLKDTMLRNTPFVKSIEQVKQEIAISSL